MKELGTLQRVLIAVLVLSILGGVGYWIYGLHEQIHSLEIRLDSSYERCDNVANNVVKFINKLSNTKTEGNAFASYNGDVSWNAKTLDYDNLYVEMRLSDGVLQSSPDGENFVTVIE